MSAGGAPGYPKYYAVNDRPIALVPTANGGVDCVAFDFDTGALVPERSYFTRLTPGAGGDVDALGEEQFAELVGQHRTDLVVCWARKFCRAGEPGEDPLGALGLAGRRDLLGAVVATSRTGRIVEFHLSGGAPTFGMLSKRLGAGVLRHSGVDPLEWRGFEVAETDAPYRVHLMAGFGEEPEPETPAMMLSLWREPAR